MTPRGDPCHDGPVVIVTGRVASRIARPLGRLLREARDRGEHLDDEVVATVTALERASRTYAARRVLATSVDGSTQRNSAEVTSGSPDALTTADVADRLRCGERNVVRLIAARQLDGHRVGRAWLVDAGSVARLLDERSSA